MRLRRAFDILTFVCDPIGLQLKSKPHKIYVKEEVYTRTQRKEKETGNYNEQDRITSD